METDADFEQALEASYTEPVCILKHSVSCGTSHMAFDAIQQWLSGQALPARRYLLTVQLARALSAAVAARLGVRHESPQVLVLKDGQVTWHGSHFRVTPDAIARAVGVPAA